MKGHFILFFLSLAALFPSNNIYSQKILLSLDMEKNKCLPLEIVYNYEPYSSKLSKEEQTYIIGVQANVWIEYMKTPDRVMQ